ncbi:aminotransferase-like domain-containing protein [Parachitinimonas caeni]|uniref:Putative 8-amino-7-oxononanoate synthase n=1 Tax=Parachitinimonas caeni TaxID=3031301 RepID=A0ABT7DXR6_9NEIS|nr:PLP-dependent aminotransferase family protein [Parachitinimonas caeni]MDK2124861.1 PLP-dependent aminotransferase family protein [Parachitinimonas caeni]
MPSSQFTYHHVYRYLSELIASGELAAGGRLPSLRALAEQLAVSVPTVQHAYDLLEAEGCIYRVAKSGFFVSRRRGMPGMATQDLFDTVQYRAHQPGMTVLSSDTPHRLLSFEQQLLRCERELTRRLPQTATSADQPYSDEPLRLALAMHYGEPACRDWNCEQVYIAAGFLPALAMAVRALAGRRHKALVESPCSWTILRQLRLLGIEPVEAGLDNRGRLDLDSVEQALRAGDIGFALFSSEINNPTGRVTPELDKEALAALLARSGTPLIENDQYGGLYFGDTRPVGYRRYADPDLLIVCSSFEKTLGPESSYGYLLSRNWREPLRGEHHASMVRVPALRQRAIAQVLHGKELDRHVQALRKLLAERMHEMTRLLQAVAGDKVRWSEPQGGAVLWLEAEERSDMRHVFERLVAEQVVIVPGELFGNAARYRHCCRLSYAIDWQQPVAQALQALCRNLQDRRNGETATGRLQTQLPR